jgi:hypothetical protein
MHRLGVVFALCVLLAPSDGGAQSADYVPSNRLPEGREVVAVYIGSTSCGPCQTPEVKSAIRAMKPLLAAQARRHGVALSVIGVADDWDLQSGARFLEPLGAFDQVVIGGNWTNLGIEHFILRDTLTEMSMPQVVVVERTVTLGKRITVSEPRVLRRISGVTDIPAWVGAGAPIELREEKKSP